MAILIQAWYKMDVLIKSDSRFWLKQDKSFLIPHRLVISFISLFYVKLCVLVKLGLKCSNNHRQVDEDAIGGVCLLDDYFDYNLL